MFAAGRALLGLIFGVAGSNLFVDQPDVYDLKKLEWVAATMMAVFAGGVLELPKASKLSQKPLLIWVSGS